MSKMKHASGYTVRGDIAYGVYHAMLRLKPKTGEAESAHRCKGRTESNAGRSIIP